MTDLPLAFGEPVRPSWHIDAACRGMGPALFYSEPGGDSRPAKQWCTVCPVQAECAADAIENNELYGTWGGLAPKERRDVRRHLHLVGHTAEQQR